MSESQLVVMPPAQIVDVSERALSVDQIVKQRSLITECMAKAMKEDLHFGKIPGCGEKPTLLQPGAQLLAHLFRLRPEYDVTEADLEHGHKRFRVLCRLLFIGSQPEIEISEGVGESSSMESKHRFRNASPVVTPTGDVVPSTFWDIKNKTGMDAAKAWAAKSYDGKSVGVKKINDRWEFVFVEGSSDEKVENSNPPDVFNTVLKIAKKRAFVDAVITATASSDFFTQDLEDIRENLSAVETRDSSHEATSGASPDAESASTERKAPPRDSATSWQDVVCTYGKRNGPLRGKKLGELNDDSLAFIWAAFKDKEAKPADRKMVAALAIWHESGRNVARQPAAANGDLPKFNGPNHEKLFEQLVWDKISVEDFLEAMRAAQVLPETAKVFSKMSEETAKMILADMETAREHVRLHLDLKKEREAKKK
jgi:hypothetical protein